MRTWIIETPADTIIVHADSCAHTCDGTIVFSEEESGALVRCVPAGTWTSCQERPEFLRDPQNR